VIAPVYHGEVFSVNVVAQENNYSARLESRNNLCANAEISLNEILPMAPRLQQYNFLNDNYQKPPVTRDIMQALLDNGCPSMQFEWRPDHEMANYCVNSADMPLLLQTNTNIKGAQAKANLSFVLGCANRHFAGVAEMSPWVHLESRSQNFQAINLNTHLISEMEILDLFSKKGHEFADCEFNLFEAASDQCVCSIWQRAIYKLRTN